MFPITDWLDSAEASAAKVFEEALADESVLDALAGAWRASFAAQGAIDPQWRQAVPGAQSLLRGGADGGLADDYPSGLTAATKTAWTAAIQALAAQHVFTPWVRPGVWGVANPPVEKGPGAAELGALALQIGSAPDPGFAPTPSEVVETFAGFRLRRLLSDGAGEPIVVISSLINRWYILDFLEGQSFLSAVAALGRPVYLLEGLPPGKGPDDRSLGDLCAGPVLGAVDHVISSHECGQAAVIGYCMGGTLSAMLAARYPTRVSRLATVCGPVKFAEGGMFTRWFAPRYLDVSAAASAVDNVPAWLVHLPFWWLRPSIKTQKMSRLIKSAGREGYIDRFLAAEIWNHDNMDMARGVFRSWAGDLYQQDALANGQFIVDGEAVDLTRITMPLAVISAEHDAITPAPACEALTDLAGAESVQVLRAKASHTGVLSAPRVLNEAARFLGAWITLGET